jgi:hypothetical protein
MGDDTGKSGLQGILQAVGHWDRFLTGLVSDGVALVCPEMCVIA